MAEYTKQEIFDIITEYLELYGSAIGSEAVHELTPEELTDENLRVLTIPGMRPDTEEWVQTSMRNIMKPVTDAVSDFTTLKAEIILARDSANTAATAASNVNATLVNMTVTITDRTGQSNSVDIGFEMYRTYASVAAMKADAANVPQGKFVIIATDDPTSTENARLYVRNSNTAMSAEPFSFLSDLDQASSAAWADWLNNMKPQIEAAISQALSDHTRADGDHSTAVSDHQTAQSDHTRAESDHTRAEGDHSLAGSDHHQAENDLERMEADHSAALVATIEASRVNADLNGSILTVTNRKGGKKSADLKGPQGDKGDGINYATMTPEEKEELTLAVIERINRDGGNCWYPVDMNTLTPDMTFEKGSVVAIDGVFYRATKDTDNFPITLVVQEGKYVADVVDGAMAYWVADYTIKDGWMVFTDASIAYWRKNFDVRLKALEDRLAALEQK